MWISGLLFFLVFFLHSSHAFAWGPTTHLEYGLGALSQVGLFLPWIRALLTEYAEDYLYGSVAADITLGKKFVAYTKNCHNWQVAFDLFDAAEKDSQKAFMLGYLSHLAADTVSHNYFVPFYSMKSFQTLALRHTYWEVRMDNHAAPAAIAMVGKFNDPRYAENDELLERELACTLFSFKTNKCIFNTLMSLQNSSAFKQVRGLVAEGSEWELPREEAERFKALASKAVIDLLSSFDHAACVKLDPTGRLKIGYAREEIGKLKRYDKDERLSAEGAELFLQDASHGFQTGLVAPVLLPKVEAYL